MYFSLSLSFFTIIIIHEEARYTPSMKLVRGSTKGPEAVTRFDNQRYIFNGMFYRSRRNLRSWYAYSSTLSIARNAGKRIFERITCRASGRGGRGRGVRGGGRHAFGFRRLEFRFQPRTTRPQSRVICDDLEPVKVN